MFDFFGAFVDCWTVVSRDESDCWHWHATVTTDTAAMALVKDSLEWTWGMAIVGGFGIGQTMAIFLEPGHSDRAPIYWHSY